MKCLWIVLFSFPLYVFAQNKPILIEGASPNFFVNHTVAPKENYYSIGRIYNISPKEVAPFNNMVLESGLSLGQALRIPLTTSNFLQTGDAAADEVLVPLYHIVEGKESLYRISVNYNKLPVETLKKWNNLKGDAVANGTNLIVGYLRVKKDLSPLANMAKTKPVDNAVKPVENQNKSVTQKAESKPAVVKETLPPSNPPVTDKTNKEPVAVVVKKSDPVKKESTPPVSKSTSGGAFKGDYEKQIRNKDIAGETGEAGIFKSTSGWDDGKYYCLHNSSTPGTIIKITNFSTGKSIYAKVLDTIPDMDQNRGILIRLSNAGASELGTAETKFICSISFSK